MKVIIIIIMANILLLSSCIYKKNEQKDNPNRIVNYEMLEEEYAHFGWVFQHGEYYLLSDTIVYEYPNLNSINIGNINIHDKVMIIEDVHNQQDIDGTTSCWYKIKYNNSVGYIFGGNIAKDTFICDIDGNGMMDYFQYRISFVFANYHIDTRKDIIIYINNNKINSEKIYFHDLVTGENIYFFSFCSFEHRNNEVFISLLSGGLAGSEDFIFSINEFGNITLINYNKKGTFFENGKWVEYK